MILTFHINIQSNHLKEKPFEGKPLELHRKIQSSNCLKSSQKTLIKSQIYQEGNVA